MADERKIVIEIVSKSESTSPIKANGQVNNNITNITNNNYEVNNNVTEETIEDKTGKNVLVNQAVEQAKSLLKESISSTFNRMFSLKEDYLMENDYNIAMGHISRFTSFALTTVGGYKAGGLVGAGISVAGWGLSQGINLINRREQFYQNLNASNQQMQFSRTRAGLLDNGKGTEN